MNERVKSKSELSTLIPPFKFRLVTDGKQDEK